VNLKVYIENFDYRPLGAEKLKFYLIHVLRVDIKRAAPQQNVFVSHKWSQSM